LAPQLSVGELYQCAVKGDGTLWCWGIGQFGQMGHGDAWRDAPAALLP
jgi:alpha-tubulin suppressor-like RCC1 family protein